jgi:hypothetical protein
MKRKSQTLRISLLERLSGKIQTVLRNTRDTLKSDDGFTPKLLTPNSTNWVNFARESRRHKNKHSRNPKCTTINRYIYTITTELGKIEKR